MSTFIPMFTSPEGEAQVMRNYQALMDRWPVAYKELIVQTSFGETHVIAGGPENAQPVVLIHALLAAAPSWYQNVEALSHSYRIYVVDVEVQVIPEAHHVTAVAQPGKVNQRLLQFFGEYPLL